MLAITVHATKKWFPSTGCPALMSEPPTQYQTITRDLGNAAQDLMIEALEMASEERMAVSRHLNYLLINPWAHHSHDLVIEIMVPEISGQHSERNTRRTRITQHVLEGLEKFLALQAYRPSYMLRVEPVHSSGASVNADGKIIDEWGVTTPLNQL